MFLRKNTKFLKSQNFRAPFTFYLHNLKNIILVNVNIKLDRKFFSKNLRGTTKNLPSHFFETNQLNRHVEKTDILVKGLNKVSLD